MSETMDEYEQQEHEYESALANLEAVTSLEQTVLSSGKIDRMTMESLHRLAPETVDKNFPLATFTAEPSEQNYEVALESFSVAKAVAIAAIGGLLGAILMKLISAFRSNKVDSRTDYLDKKKSELKDGEHDLKKILARVKKLSLSTGDQLVVDAIEAWNVDFFLGETKPAGREAAEFITAIAPGGTLYRIMDRWSSDIVKHTSEFRKRVRIMTEIVGEMHEVSRDDIMSLKKKAEDITLPDNDKFMKDMQEVEVFYRTVASGSESVLQFMKEEVFQTQEFREFIGNIDRLTDYDKLYSNSTKQIQKNLKEIEDKYAPILQGTAVSQAKKKAKANVSHGISQRDGEVVISIDAGADALRDQMNRSIEAANSSLKREAMRLKDYIIFLERTLYFYQHACATREKVEREAMLKLTEIENRVQ